jgi:hypothetical protein
MSCWLCGGLWVLGIAVILVWNYGAHRNDELCRPKLYPIFCAWCKDEVNLDWTTVEGSAERSTGEQEDARLDGRHDAG